MNFKYTTLGDLRVGRNLKFVGKIYEFGIYGLAISENSVDENWQRATKYVNKNVNIESKKLVIILFYDYKFFISGAPSGARTLDQLLKRQLLYQLS